MNRSKRYRWILGGLAVLISVLIAGVIWQDFREKKSIKIVMVAKIMDRSDFWAAFGAGAQMAADEYDADYVVLAPQSEEDYESQNIFIQEAIDMKPDVIALIPSDYKETVAMAKKIKENNIKLVLVDSLLEEEIADAVIATDNEKAGRKLGEYVKKNSGEDTVIGIVSHVKGSSTAIQREEGVRKGLGEMETQVQEVVFCDSHYSTAYDVTKDLLKRRTNINLIVGLNEYSTVGAARAIKDMGLSKQVKIVGFDNSKEEIQLLEAEYIDGIMVQRPFDMGYLGIKAAADLANGKKVEKKTDSGSKLITKSSIYSLENQKLLFPFTR